MKSLLVEWPEGLLSDEEFGNLLHNTEKRGAKRKAPETNDDEEAEGDVLEGPRKLTNAKMQGVRQNKREWLGSRSAHIGCCGTLWTLRGMKTSMYHMAKCVAHLRASSLRDTLVKPDALVGLKTHKQCDFVMCARSPSVLVVYGLACNKSQITRSTFQFLRAEMDRFRVGIIRLRCSLTRS